MTRYRKIESIFKEERAYWVGNGFYVRQVFPTRKVPISFERFSPFLRMDYNAPTWFKGTSDEVGVGPHPHRGFQTVSFVFSGKVEHTDNKGNIGVIESGDIQWMTAGSGILHKEYHEKKYAEEDRLFHMIQLWVDLPTADRMDSPSYQAILKDQMAKVVPEDGLAEVTIYAGKVFGIRGPAETYSPMNIYKLDVRAGKKVEIKESRGYNTGFLILSGEVEVNGEERARAGEFVLFENEDKAYSVEGTAESSEVFVLSGKPLNQPVKAMGPFVMSTQDELRQAYADFHSGAFGSLDF